MMGDVGAVQVHVRLGGGHAHGGADETARARLERDSARDTEALVERVEGAQRVMASPVPGPAPAR